MQIADSFEVATKRGFASDRRVVLASRVRPEKLDSMQRLLCFKTSSTEKNICVADQAPLRWHMVEQKVNAWSTGGASIVRSGLINPRY